MTNRMPAEVFPPGEFIQEELEAREWTQVDLGHILGRNARLVNEIINSKRGISPETAKDLAAAFGTSPQLWLNLQAGYDLSRARETNEAVARRAQIYSKVPVKDIVRRNWVEESDTAEVLEGRIVKFFGLNGIEDEIIPLAHAARKSTPYSFATPAQAAWLIRAHQIAAMVSTKSYSRKRFFSLNAELRKLLESPEEARHVSRVLANFGIRMVVVEHLPKTKIDGAFFWLNEDQREPVIALSLRYDRIDYLWHTVYHELGHLMSGHSAIMDSDMDDGGDIVEGSQTSEQQANAFAAETLIPRDSMESFIESARPLFSGRQIRGFAAEIGVHPGIVVGQLQYRKEISYANHRKMLVRCRGIVTEATLTDGWSNTLPVAV